MPVGHFDPPWFLNSQKSPVLLHSSLVDKLTQVKNKNVCPSKFSAEFLQLRVFKSREDKKNWWSQWLQESYEVIDNYSYRKFKLLSMSGFCFFYQAFVTFLPFSILLRSWSQRFLPWFLKLTLRPLRNGQKVEIYEARKWQSGCFGAKN